MVYIVLMQKTETPPKETQQWKDLDWPELPAVHRPNNHQHLDLRWGEGTNVATFLTATTYPVQMLKTQIHLFGLWLKLHRSGPVNLYLDNTINQYVFHMALEIILTKMMMKWKPFPPVDHLLLCRLMSSLDLTRFNSHHICSAKTPGKCWKRKYISLAFDWNYLEGAQLIYNLLLCRLVSSLDGAARRLADPTRRKGTAAPVAPVVRRPPEGEVLSDLSWSTIADMCVRRNLR